MEGLVTNQRYRGIYTLMVLGTFNTFLNHPSQIEIKSRQGIISGQGEKLANSDQIDKSWP
jgi:hypothetical protein